MHISNFLGKLEKEGCMIAMTSHMDYQMVTMLSEKMHGETIYHWYRDGHVEMMETEEFSDIALEPMYDEKTFGRNKRQAPVLKRPGADQIRRPDGFPENMELVLEVSTYLEVVVRGGTNQSSARAWSRCQKSINFGPEAQLVLEG